MVLRGDGCHVCSYGLSLSREPGLADSHGEQGLFRFWVARSAFSHGKILALPGRNRSGNPGVLGLCCVTKAGRSPTLRKGASSYPPYSSGHVRMAVSFPQACSHLCTRLLHRTPASIILLLFAPQVAGIKAYPKTLADHQTSCRSPSAHGDCPGGPGSQSVISP